jgi:hypothetical protein
MAKKEGEENIRKLARVGGGHTYGITLPIEAIRKFGWQESQRIKVEIDEKNKRFILKDWEE